MAQRDVALGRATAESRLDTPHLAQDEGTGIPAHWQVVRLGTRARLITKGSSPKWQGFNYSADGIPFVRAQNVGWGSLELADMAYLPVEFNAKEKKSVLQTNDMLVTIAGTIGRVALATEQVQGGNVNQAVAVVRLDGTCLPSFMMSFLLTEAGQTQLRGRAKEVVQANVSLEDIKHLWVPMPSVEEQGAIARMLRTVQDAIRARTRELELERERKAALMQHLFTHGTRGEPTKLTEIGEMPESWQVVELGTKAQLVTKGSSPKWQGFAYTADGTIFVRAQNVGWGRLELADLAYLPIEFNAKEKKSVLRADDVLVTIAGTIGRVAVATQQVEGGNVNQAVAVVRLDGTCVPTFVMSFLLTEAGQAQLRERAKEVIQANVSLEDIKHLWVPMPSAEEQQYIANTVCICDEKIASLERETGLLEELFRALLEELMTGRLSALPLVEATAEVPA
jgi:type I restriction enzyme S subunit